MDLSTNLLVVIVLLYTPLYNHLLCCNVTLENSLPCLRDTVMDPYGSAEVSIVLILSTSLLFASSMLL